LEKVNKQFLSLNATHLCNSSNSLRLSAVSLAKSGTLSNIQESEIDESVQSEISEPIGKGLFILDSDISGSGAEDDE
jgi:hypothetical protein